MAWSGLHHAFQCHAGGGFSTTWQPKIGINGTGKLFINHYWNH